MREGTVEGEHVTRLKMVVNAVTDHGGPNVSSRMEEISASAVISDKEGSVNKQWSKWTPSGTLKFTVSNENVFDRLRPGDYFYLDVVRCDKDAL